MRAPPIAELARLYAARGVHSPDELDDALAQPVQQRTWTAAARLEAVIATAAMDEAGKSAWCREQGVYPAELGQWFASATSAHLTAAS